MPPVRSVSLWALASILAGPSVTGPGVVAAARGHLLTQSRTVTFSRDIAPIVFARCGTCHQPDGPAPFSLLTYSSARQHAAQIALVTKSRLMPPWKVERGYGPFVGQQLLDDNEIALIQRWVEEGAIEGNLRDLPPQPPPTQGGQLGKPDVIVQPPAYVLKADGADVFRIFVIRLPVDSVRYVKGVEFHPGNPKVVHHTNIRMDRTAASRLLDEQDPDPGYEGLIAPSVVDPDGHFLGWTPGQVAALLPKELSWRLEPGTDLVVEMHMLPSGRPETVQPSIGLFFDTAPAGRTPTMLRLGRQNIDIPAGEKNYTIADSFVLPVDVEVHALQPHAHYRAREISGVATLPDGTVKPLIQIKDWDFRWQHVYRYVTPVVLPSGTTLEMRFTYDNSAENPRNPQQPPQRVVWGQRSFDEMGDLSLQLLTRDEQNRATLRRAIQPKLTAENIVGYETLIRSDPTRVSLHDDVALLYRESGRHEEEIAHYETSVKLLPSSPAAHLNLGAALADAGRTEEAIAQYRRALQLRADYPLAHSNLAQALLRQGQLDEAKDHYGEALRLEPNNADAHNNLGYVFLRQEHFETAISHFREALTIDAASSNAHYNMGRALRRRGELTASVEHFQQALRVAPDWTPALVNLAWLFATASDAGLRRGEDAVRLAERAAALTGHQDAAVLDVLAAAYAATGQFNRAVEAAGTALRLGPEGAALSAIRLRRTLYEQRTAYRVPAGEADEQQDLLTPYR